MIRNNPVLTASQLRRVAALLTTKYGSCSDVLSLEGRANWDRLNELYATRQIVREAQGKFL